MNNVSWSRKSNFILRLGESDFIFWPRGQGLFVLLQSFASNPGEPGIGCSHERLDNFPICALYYALQHPAADRIQLVDTGQVLRWCRKFLRSGMIQNVVGQSRLARSGMFDEVSPLFGIEPHVRGIAHDPVDSRDQRTIKASSR